MVNHLDIAHKVEIASLALVGAGNNVQVFLVFHLEREKEN